MANVQQAGLSYQEYLAQVAGAAVKTITDPGDAGTIDVSDSGVLLLTVASGSETRTLPAPTFVGQKIDVGLDVNNGTDVAVTTPRSFDSLGNSTLTFSVEGSGCRLIGIKTGTVEGAPDFEWRLFPYEGVSAAPTVS